MYWNERGAIACPRHIPYPVAEVREDYGSMRDKIARMTLAIDAALHELGMPGPGYPAPVANAVDILRVALASTEEPRNE